jgi:hypothetical protein
VIKTGLGALDERAIASLDDAVLLTAVTGSGTVKNGVLLGIISHRAVEKRFVFVSMNTFNSSST